MSFEIEMATLKVNSSHWEIGPKRKRFLKSLVKRFGDEVIPDFNKLITNPYYTLQYLATKYDITRERVRQLVQEVYGYRYTHFLLKLREQKAEDKVYCRRHPIERDGKKGGTSEAEAFRKLKEMGMDVKGSPTIQYDMVVNGYKVDVKECSKPKAQKHQKSSYYHFHVTKQQIELCDFFICHALDTDRWFVIANYKKGEKGYLGLYIRSNIITADRYKKINSMVDPTLHENNWSILKKTN